jgi:hypothetical protein
MFLSLDPTDIELVVSRITNIFIGFGTLVDPRADAVELALTVKLGMNMLSRPVETFADSLTTTALQVLTPLGDGEFEPDGWQLSLLVSFRQVGDELPEPAV